MGTWLRLAACVRVCVFLCPVSCVPTLSVDPEDSQVDVRCWRKLEGQSRIVAGVATSPRKSDRSTDFEWTVTARHSPRVRSTIWFRSTWFTDGQKVLGTQDKEVTSIAAVSKRDTEILQKSGTACIPRRAVWFQRRVLYDRLVKQCIIK